MRGSPKSATATLVPSSGSPKPQGVGIRSPLESLVTAAVQAPSGDNLQPWRFVLDPNQRTIAIYVDEARDPSPMNAGQRMSRIAVGAALENLLRAAENLGYGTQLQPPRDNASAVVRVTDSDGSGGQIDPVIAARVTNRRVYEARCLPQDLADKLRRECPEWDGVRTHWIDDRTRLGPLASLIGRADALMLGEASIRRDFIGSVSFDAPSDTVVKEGLPLESLELSALDRIGLRLMPHIPDFLLKMLGARRLFAAAARRLVESASGLCLVVEAEGTPQSEVLAGRAMQRAWLALTASGLAAQPMMSLAILENVLSRGTPELLASLGRDKAAALIEEFHDLVPEIGDGNVAFIMRFGLAPAPTVRAGRLPLEASTSFVDSSEQHLQSGSP